MLTFRQTIVLLAAEFCFCALKVECSTNFTECYNTTTEMHCFSKIGTGPVNYSEAQKCCSEIDATLLVIKNNEVQTLLETFILNVSKSVGLEDSILYFWTNANRIVASGWQWLNSSVINELNVNMTTRVSYDVGLHVASVARQDINQQEVWLITNNPGETMSYICEFFGSYCKNQHGNVLQYGDKCYVASEDDTTWYDARNRCLKEQGDLASFGDLRSTNINFLQWLDLSTGKQYWVGARILWWSWQNTDDAEVRYTSWLHGYPVGLNSDVKCLSVCINSGIMSEINGWKNENCNQDRSVGVICQKVSPLVATTTLMVTTSAYAFNKTSATAMLNATIQQGTLGIGLGVGVGFGVPLVIFIIITLYIVVKRKRSETPPNHETRNKSNELGTVQEPSVGEVNESEMDHYQRLNRNLNNTSGTTYDSLKIESAQNYEEFTSSTT